MERRRKTNSLFLLHPKLINPSFPLIISLITALAVYLLMASSFNELFTKKTARARPSRCQCQSQRPLMFAEPQDFHVLSTEKSRRNRSCAMAYSAYFDHRDHAVKIVTDSDLSCFRSVSVTCQLWYKSSSSPFLSNLTFDYHLLKNENREAADRLGAIYSCMASSTITDLPYAVSFYSRRDVCKCHATLSMEIHYPRSPMYKFVVCVPALYGNLRVEEIIWFVELHRVLGAEKFYFYNESIPADVNRVLKSYSERGVAEVLKWRPPFPTRQIYHNQQVMQLDCSMRNLRQSEWVAQMDVDEALMPTNGLTWQQLLSTTGRSNTGALLFLNRFFAEDDSVSCPNTQPHTSEDFSYDRQWSWLSNSSQGVPVYLRRLRYYDEAFPPNDRSKIMYRPEATAQTRTHMAALRPGFDLVILNYNQGANCHYRHAPSISTNRTLFCRSACFHDATLRRNVHQMVASIAQRADQ